METKKTENDELILCNNQWFSLREILGEEGYNIYYNSKSEKVRDLVKLKVFIDLSAMELAFERLNKLN